MSFLERAQAFLLERKGLRRGLNINFNDLAVPVDEDSTSNYGLGRIDQHDGVLESVTVSIPAPADPAIISSSILQEPPGGGVSRQIILEYLGGRFEDDIVSLNPSSSGTIYYNKKGEQPFQTYLREVRGELTLLSDLQLGDAARFAQEYRAHAEVTARLVRSIYDVRFKLLVPRMELQLPTPENIYAFLTG